MLGIPDITIWGAYVLCLISAGTCLIYGIYCWNMGAEKEEQQVLEEKVWEKNEQSIEAAL